MRKYIVIVALIILVALTGFIIFTTNKSTSTTKTQQTKEQVKIIVPTPLPLTEVILGKNGFSPITLTINAGSTVIWRNESLSEGSVSSDPHPTHESYPFINLGIFPASSSVQTRFEKPGTYTYHNHLKPSQKGTVIVK